MPTRRAGILPWPVVAAAIASAAVLGAFVAAAPGILRIDFALTPQGLGLLVGALAIAGLAVSRPDIGLVLLAAFVYLNLSQVLVRHHRWPSLLQFLVFPLLLGASIRRETADLRRIASSALTLLLAGYGLVVFLSTTLARDTSLADPRVVENARAFLIYLLAALLASSAAAARRGVWTLLGAGALLGGLALVQVLSGNFRDEYGGLARIKHAQIYGDVFEPRIAGPLGDPNFFAQVLVMLVPLALLTAKAEKTLQGRSLALLSAGLVTAAAVLTYSRGGALALACVLALCLVSLRVRLRKVALGGGLVALLGLLLVPAGFTRRLSTLEQILPGSEEVLRPDSSFQKRRLLVGAAWRMFLDHPVLGVGAGNYTVHFEEYASDLGSASRDYEDPGEPHYPHNLYLEVGAETGLVGLLAFGAALAACFRALRRAHASFEEAGDRPSAALARGFEIALVGYLVSSLFLHGHFQRYLWLLFGFATGLATLAGGKGDRSAARGAP